MTESIYLIYKHTSPSGKSYIGQTKDYKQRCWQHQRPTSRCKAFAAAIKKYGWDNFTHELLVEHITEDEANTLEIFYIKEHQSLFPGGYNLTEGGDARLLSEETKAKIGAANKGKVHTDESKAKMAAARMGKVLSGEHKAKLLVVNTGRTFSEEHKAKIGAANKGKVHTDESKAKMAAARIGKPGRMQGKKHTDEAMKKIMEVCKNRPKVTCMYCEKISTQYVINRWHNNNCKTLK
jgi:group I intron endonuclease